MQMTIELPDEINQEQAAIALEDVAKALRDNEDLDQKELMDGSIIIETRVGIVLLSLEF